MATSTNVQVGNINSLGSVLRNSKVAQAGWVLLVMASSATFLYVEHTFDLMKDITAVWSSGTAITVLGTVIPLLLATVDLRSRGQSWADLGLKRPKNLFRALLMVPAIFLLALVANVGLNVVLDRLIEPTPVNVSHLDNMTGNLPGFIWAMVVMWASAAFAEEMLFRGYLMTRLSELLGPRTAGWVVALIVSTLLFGVSHAYQGPTGIIATGVSGLVFGIGYLVSRRNLWPIIIVHGIVNSIGFVALYLGVSL